MFGKLLPQNVDFFLFFETHIEIAKKSSELLLKMIQTHTNYSNEILITEKEADRVTQQCIEALHQTFITPIERHDIQRLMSKMDDIVDMIEEIASKLVIYQLHPHEYPIEQMATLLSQSIQLLQPVVFSLRTNQMNTETVQGYEEIHQIENKADILVRQSIGSLFEKEKDPVKIIKWKEIYEDLENAIDGCEKVAHIIDGIMIENS